MTPHSKPQLLGHLRAERLPLRLRVLLRVPAELEDGHENCESQAAKQHHKHSTDVLDAQGVRLRFLVLLVAAADLARVLPPLIVKYLYCSLFLQLENGQRDFIAPYASLRRGDAVSFCEKAKLIETR